MKKLLFIFVVAIALTSCNSAEYYQVTVIEKTGKYIGKFPMYKVVTKSGDTLVVRVKEEIAFNNKLPYEAILVRAERNLSTAVVTRTALSQKK